MIELSDDDEPPAPKRPRYPYQPPPTAASAPTHASASATPGGLGSGGPRQFGSARRDAASLQPQPILLEDDDHGDGDGNGGDDGDDDDAQLAAALAASRASHAEEQRRRQGSSSARPDGAIGGASASASGSDAAARAARPSPLSGSPPGTRVVVLVDERERQANSNPLSIYLNLHKTLDEGGGALGFACEVRRQSLKLGDFGWALEAADGELRVLPALVERKRIGHRCAEN